MTNEVSQQTDMITRVFWIAVSLFESDYDHEYLMAVELLNQVRLTNDKNLFCLSIKRMFLSSFDTQINWASSGTQG